MQIFIDILEAARQSGDVSNITSGIELLQRLQSPAEPGTDGEFDTASDGEMEVDTIAGQMLEAVLQLSPDFGSVPPIAGGTPGPESSATAHGCVGEGSAAQASKKRAALLVTLKDKARTLVKQRKKVKSSS